MGEGGASNEATLTNVYLADCREAVYVGLMSETSKRPPPSRPESESSLPGALFRNLVSLFFVAVSVMSVYNVFGVGGEVEAMAKETACQGQTPPCTAQYTRAERRPWAHSFRMYTSAKSGEKDIECMRQYILIGDYSCKVKGAEAHDGAGPADSAQVAPSSSVPVRFPQKLKAPVAPKPSATP